MPSSSKVCILIETKEKSNHLQEKMLTTVAVLVNKNHNGFSPVNPLHKKSCLPKDELIICRVDVKIWVRVEGVKRIPIGARRDHYAIEEIFTSANMTMMELDK